MKENKFSFLHYMDFFSSYPPKICVSLTSSSWQEIDSEITEILKTDVVSIIEWRIDRYASTSIDTLLSVLSNIRQKIGNTILLTTFRTHSQGGHQSITSDQYIQLYQAIIKSKKIDMIDIEMTIPSPAKEQLIDYATRNQVLVLLSYHNFTITPSIEEMVETLMHMQETGANIAKIAVMPETTADVYRLLQATMQAHTNCTIPIVTIAMGRLGRISRIAGETFGSQITFGSVCQPSAPGQIPATLLASILQQLHI